MKILLTGASGYIGSHLLPELLKEGHEVYALTRSGKQGPLQGVTWVQGDLLERGSLAELQGIDAAYYLVHSMADDPKHFEELEERAALNFVSMIEGKGVRQIIYLSGLHHGKDLSRHFRSRVRVEECLRRSGVSLTVIRASIIVGKGSSSFTIVSDLVQRLPVMIAPRWLKTRCQPIAIADVLYYLVRLLGKREAMNRTFEVGGPDVMTFKEMLLTYAELRGLKRWIITVPLLTPRLSSYWLYLVTKVNFSLASTLVESLKVESVVENRDIQSVLPHTCRTYESALRQAL